jgi:hypothetical protein
VADEQQPPDLSQAIGGWRGIIETSLPTVAFVIAYPITGSDVEVSAAIAVGLALLIAVFRLARRDTPRHAAAGLVGIAFAAFVATRSGRAEDFFLPGLLANAAYASAFLISLALRKPLVGVLAAQFDRAHADWRDAGRYGAYVRATWLWAGLFGLRLLVQLPLYLAGTVVALGVARTAMGLPLFALGLWLTWLLVRPRGEPGAAAAR